MQYTVEKWDSYNGYPADLKRTLNRMAKQGWRLVSTSTGSGNNIYLFFEGEGEAEDEKEQTHFDVILKSAGSAKLTVVKAVKELAGLGLKEAKDIVDAAPTVLAKGVARDEAEALKRYLEEVGAEITIR